ncbi:hypothetical protein GCM10022239_11760 [Leifsonia bigeumensis]|uniref:Uncharacterized protein n=1 Tax=Leifsonella bigeumensis TaxID=433643 RepID=A0ABP7FEI7_9MICO
MTDQSLAAWVRAHVDEVRGWPAISRPDRMCLVAVCDRPVFASLLCKTHYKHAVLVRRIHRDAMHVVPRTAIWPEYGMPVYADTNPQDLGA